MQDFCVAELKTRISRQTSEVERLRTDLETANISLQEAQALNDQLQESAKRHEAISNPTDYSHTAASGIGDLNPELAQKLARLTHENRELRKQLDDETTERVSALVDEIEDVQRLKFSFESKYFDIKQQLEANADELAHARRNICDKDESLEIKETDNMELLATCDTLRLALKEANVQVNQLLTKVNILENEVEERKGREQILNAHVTHLESKTHRHQSTIIDLQNNLNTMREHCWMLQEDIFGYSAERANAVDERSQLRRQIAELQCMHNETRTQLDQMFQRCQKLDNQVAKQAVTIENCTLMLENERELNTINSKTTKEILRQTNERHIEELRRSNQEHERIKLESKEEHQTKIMDCENRIRELENMQIACIARMTDTIDMKSSTIEKLKTELQQNIVQHANELEILRTGHGQQQQNFANEMQAVRIELANYIDMHSVSDADWAAKEQSMQELAETQIQQLQTSNNSMRLAFEQQKEEFLQQIETQLNENSLIKKEKRALKIELANAHASITQLENSVTRLESKAVLLEKERAHFSNEGEKKRDVEDEQSTLSARLNVQTALLVAEFDKLHQEHKTLQQERRNCQCDCLKSMQRSSLKDAKKDGQQLFSSQIRQLEYAKQQEEAKRRELMLLNTKLLQEQKQMHIKNNALSNETQQLKDKINSSLLRDERRKKELNQLRQEVTFLRAETAHVQNTTKEVLHSSQYSIPAISRSRPVERASLSSGNAPLATDTVQIETDVDKDVFTPNKKRKKKHVVEMTANVESLHGHPPKAAKRRMPVLFRNKSHTEKEDSASECKQQ